MKSFIKKIVKKAGFSFFRGNVIPFDTRQMRNVLLYAAIWEKITDLSGSIVECGVGKGRSILILTFLAAREKNNRHVWGFDSFCGFPEISSEDDSVRHPKKGDWSGTSMSDIQSILDRAGLSEYRLKGNSILVPGFFEDSLNKYTGGPIAFLHVDCDLYQSYKFVLEHMVPLVVPGGVVLFDEYNEEKWPGAKKAVDEFLKKNAYVLEQELIGGKYFFIKK